ncbi:hypothetical protein [Streptomyces sp. NBC_00503]|uniref:hypothetical protein n=1 Tax=Streptomyces sp. NBC_00503 TaxID=2903659 RepID=UPI002E80001A|nr:hypothetical protein [Streptomyces sp. NBC_00503]WUD86430.1 hypothetical protein OG490_38110 [Streptomyces sp. NBC_00503]
MQLDEIQLDGDGAPMPVQAVDGLTEQQVAAQIIGIAEGMFKRVKNSVEHPRIQSAVLD